VADRVRRDKNPLRSRSIRDTETFHLIDEGIHVRLNPHSQRPECDT